MNEHILHRLLKDKPWSPTKTTRRSSIYPSIATAAPCSVLRALSNLGWTAKRAHNSSIGTCDPIQTPLSLMDGGWWTRWEVDRRMARWMDGWREMETGNELEWMRMGWLDQTLCSGFCGSMSCLPTTRKSEILESALWNVWGSMYQTESVSRLGRFPGPKNVNTPKLT